MGRASSNKKVNRAASTGGGRTARGRTPILWYSTLFLAVALGIFTVFVSAQDIRDVAADDTQPRVGKDHWHAAYGIFICDSWVAPLNDANRDRYGIHSHGDGLIHTHPAVQSAAGKGATFGKFMEEVDAKVSATSISVPKSSGAKRLSVKNGEKCGKEKASVKTVIFKNQADTKGKELKGDPSDWKIGNGEIIAVAFVTEGAVVTPPPAASNLSDPGDLPGSGSGAPGIPNAPPVGSPPSLPPPAAEGSATTAPPSATTTP